MEKYNFTLKRRFYPGEVEIIPPQLPKSYVALPQPISEGSAQCDNCYFNNGGFCNYWKGKIRKEFICNKWTSIGSQTNQLPESPPCLTGFTLPIIITEDFNDIGVYTPFDGLVLQRDVINNFVYTADGFKVMVYNTSDIDFKRFLTFGNYIIDWGDGSTPATLSLGAMSASHTYSGPKVGGYTITLKQVNPWGTTIIQKVITLPYTSQVNIPNPFGILKIHPPNLGDPVGCDTFYQSYIFSGDSNPDVYDFLSFHSVSVPYIVTGYTENSRLSLFTRYGPTLLPPTGLTQTLVENLSGEIIEVTDSYTSYTVNNITYTDFKDDKTYFQAYSTGWNIDNLEWLCCDETASDPCQCKEFGTTIPTGDWDSTKTYIRTATVLYNDCCWYCNPSGSNLYECFGRPSSESTLWVPCIPCNAIYEPPPEEDYEVGGGSDDACEEVETCEEGFYWEPWPICECVSESGDNPGTDCPLEIFMERLDYVEYTWGTAQVKVYFDNQLQYTYAIPGTNISHSETCVLPYGSTLVVEYVGTFNNKPNAYKVLFGGTEIFSNGYPLGTGPNPETLFCAKCTEAGLTPQLCSQIQ